MADVAEPAVWCRATVIGPGGDEVERWVLSGPGRPDLAAVDVLARLELEARRRGARLVVEALCPLLAELLEVSGLGRRVGVGREVGRQAEEREDRPGVEEAVEPTDPPV